MTTRTFVRSSRGPHHSGPGDQHIYYQDIASSVREKPERPPRQVAGEGVRHLRRRFVTPEGMDECRVRLEQSNVVLLDAAPGSGARSAAMVLLWEFPHGQELFHELLDQAEEEGGDGRALDPEHVKEEALLLLDLSAAAKSRYPVLMRDLASLRVTVRERHARLAVVLSPEHRELLSDELRDLVAKIGRPEESKVLCRHLYAGSGIRPQEQDLADPDLSAFLAGASMGRIAKLAEEIGSERGKNRDGDFKSWAGAALSAMRPDDTEVAALTAGLTGPERALLLAVAFLEGATSQAIYGAANRLLETTGHPLETAPSLQHQSLADRLGNIEASADGDRGQVQFNAKTMAEAVRSFFWNNFPQLRGELQTWIGSAARFPHVEREDLLKLVQRYAALCLRSGLPGLLTALAEQWTQKSATTPELLMAARALGEGVQHPRHGSHFRRELYLWSREKSLLRGRANVLVGVCSEALSVGFPRQALVRLHHLSHNRDAHIVEIAREALARITEYDDYLYAQLLRRLLGHVRSGSAEGAGDIGTFLHVAGPGRLLDDPAGREPLTELWAAALSRGHDPELLRALRAWLDGAASGAGPVSPVISVLAEACARNGLTLPTVHDAAYGWAGSDGRRLRVAEALWSQATAALGINPPTLTY